MADLDAYREAFDIHGKTVHCWLCKCEMDELTVQHHHRDHPLCDRCYWDEQNEKTDQDDYREER